MRLLHHIRKDELLRHAGILFSSMMAVHVCSVVFQMAVGRVLPDEEYALLAAFLGLLAIIQRPLGTLRTAVCYYGSLLVKEDRRGDVKRLLKKWLILTGIPSTVAGLLVILLSEHIAGFFHLDRNAPVIIAGALLPVLCWLPITNGAAQGFQMFNWISASAILGAVVRLALGAGFVWFLYAACGWAMLGHGLGLYATFGVIFIGLWLGVRGRPVSRQPLPSMRFYILQSFFVQASYAVLMTADVILIKHFLPDDTEFAYAATLGRMVLFFSGAIAAAMFPKVSSRGATTADQYKIFLQSFKYTLLCVVVAVLGCSLLPGVLVKILFGISDPSPFLLNMTRVMALVMGASALLNVVVQFLLAQRRFKMSAVVVVAACVYLVGAFIWNASSWHIVIIAGLSNMLALVAGVSFIYFDKRKGLNAQ